MDALIRSTICKHIHLVVKYITTCHSDSSSGHELQHIYITQQKQTQKVSTATLLSKLSRANQTTNQLKDTLKSQLSVLAGKIHSCHNHDTLLSVQTKLNTIIATIDTANTSTTNFPCSIKITPSNTKIVQQRPFLSTKKQRQSEFLNLLPLRRRTFLHAYWIPIQFSTVSYQKKT